MTYFNQSFDAYYGLDVHQATISISRALPDGECEYVTTLTNQTKAIDKFFKKELKTYANIQTAYEAGGCGFAVHHALVAHGIESQVIAPSLIPKIPGKRKKNDKVDSMNLATFLRDGLLVPIHIPEEEQIEVREHTRQRECFTAQLRVARQQVLSMLRRHGKRYTKGKKNWTKTYWGWLRGVEMPSLLLQEVLATYVDHVTDLQEKIAKIDRKLIQIHEDWTKASVSKGLATLRGIDTLTATSIVAEVDEFGRFETAGEFMSYLGLTPSEFSSGERVTRNRIRKDKVHRGAITKAGNGRIRRLLVEAAWSYRHLPRKYKALKKRWLNQPQEITNHAWKAQRRLYNKYRSMSQLGKSSTLVNVSVARELAGFVWAIGIMAESLLTLSKKAA